MKQDRGNTHMLLGGLSLIMILLATYAAFIYAPLEKSMMEVQKIFYFHVASAWNAALAYLVVFIGSVAYLIKRERKWDTLAGVSAEIGVVFTTIVLITGPIWGRFAWNKWWGWEPRLTTTLILWFIYLAYLLIRAAMTEGNTRPVLAAVFGIIGFVNVPIVYFSIQWWGRQSHPEVFVASQGGLDPRMLQALIFSVFAFTFLYLYLLQKGIYIEQARQKVEEVKEYLREKFN
ncbi:MAG: cytochrome c biogenesis protein [Bacillota bacterium]